MDKILALKLLKKSGISLRSVICDEISSLSTLYFNGESCDHVIEDAELETLEILLGAFVSSESHSQNPGADNRVHDHTHSSNGQDKLETSSEQSNLYDRVLDLAVHVSKANIGRSSGVSVSVSVTKTRLLRLIQLSYSKASKCFQGKLQNLCLQSLLAFTADDVCIEGSHNNSNIDIHLAITIAYFILTSSTEIPSSWLDETFNCTEKIITAENEEIVGKLLGMVLPGLLKRAQEKELEAKLSRLWITVDNLYERYGQKTFETVAYTRLSGRPLMILCGLADWLFPVEGQKLLLSPIKDDGKFWTILQAGFYNSNPLTRKRSCYILKRLLDIVEKSATEIQCYDRLTDEITVPIFWWTKDYSRELDIVWQDYILLMETLEEKQVHVIKPLLPRLGPLVAATHLQQAAGDGSARGDKWSDRPLLHTSWVCTLFQRMACHESSFIRRTGITELLQIDMSTFPLLQQNGQEFLCEALLAMLAESVVYYKPPELPLGECAPAGHLVVTFLQSCMTALHKPQLQGAFLQRFIAGLCDRKWSGVALVFVSRGLAMLPRLRVCSPQIVQDIRTLLLAVLTNLEVHVRGAVQCFLATAVTKLLDTDCSGPLSLLPLLSVVRGEECLCRGTSLWADYTAWLQTAAATSPTWSGQTLHTFITDQLTTYLSAKPGSSDGPVEVVALVRLLLLAADSGLLPAGPRDTSPVVGILRPVIDILLTINSHAYMAAAKADCAIQLLTTVLQEIQSGLTGEDDLCVKVRSLAAECIDEILLFIIRRVTSDIKELDYVAVVGWYTEALRTLQAAGLEFAACRHLTQGIPILAAGLFNSEKGTQQPSLEIQMRRFALVSVLGTLAGVIRSGPPSSHATRIQDLFYEHCHKLKPDHCFSRPATDGTETQSGHGSSSWGRVSASFIQGQWECMQLLLEASPPTPEQLTDLAARCQDALDVTSGATIIPIMQCTNIFIAQLETPLLSSLVELMWRKVLEERRNTLFFWSCVDAFVDTVLTPELLLTTDEQLTDVLSKVMTDFLYIGEEKQGLVNVLATRLCLLCQNPDHQVALLDKYCDVIVNAVSFGPIHDKNLRYCQEVLAFITGLGDELAINQLRDGNLRNESVVRVLILSELSRLSVDIPSHVEFVHRLLRLLFARHTGLNKNKKYRRYNNSLPHRQKHRLMIAILILHPFILKGLQEETMTHMLEQLVQENQPSVRFMVEWLVVRTILLRTDLLLLEQLVVRMEEQNERRMAFLCSLFTIATHVAKNIDSSKQEAAVLRVMPAILPWCTMHHFNCRTFAQACLLVLWRTSQERGLQRVLSGHAIVEGIVKFQMNNINQSKGTQKLLDNFFFHFDPIQDYSLETLLWTLPRLVAVTEEEWVVPCLIARSVPSWKTTPAAHSLPLLNPRQRLQACTYGTWKVKPTEGEDFQTTEGNVQKKLIPWTSMLPEQELEPELVEELPARPETGGLVVVTSLIDKVPNLGGLCRTSEIFGVAEFVIGNLKYVNLHEFETLSVTAHKWVPIKEVRPWMLKTYLLQMKEKGYTLVGAEQTADSVSLCDYQFPDKTLLVLGNEKEGIPVELIQLLDVCVEIPQQGVVRSLNVHVSGALLVWEYTRQRLATAALPSVQVP